MQSYSLLILINLAFAKMVIWEKYSFAYISVFIKFGILQLSKWRAGVTMFMHTL